MDLCFLKTYILTDLGITVGAVVIPQGMAYAKLAQLDVEFGLYSSFMGVLIYWFFATSKDITIGPVAVLSTSPERDDTILMRNPFEG